MARFPSLFMRPGNKTEKRSFTAFMAILIAGVFFAPGKTIATAADDNATPIVNCASTTLQQSRGASRRPNFLFILADDLAYRDLRFMGNPLVKTPHLDRLAKQSLVFPNGYVSMSVCRPSLATILTGLDPHQHGIYFNHPPPGLAALRKLSAEEYRSRRRRTDGYLNQLPTLPRILATHGYACLQTGKHWEGHFKNVGFTHGMTLNKPHARIADVTGTRLQHNGEPVAHGNGDAGLRIGRETLEPIDQFLDQHAGRSPICVWYAPFMPHTPFDASEEFHASYRGKKLPTHLKKYYAEITRFDATVGRVLERFEKHKLLKNTCIVFLSDNGFRPSSKNESRADSRSKLSFYEDGLRTPILFSWPGRIQPERSHCIVETVDILPTVLHAAGLSHEITPAMRGKNLLDTKTTNQPGVAFGAVYPNDARTLNQPETHHQARWIRLDSWKLIVPSSRLKTASLLLFNLDDDPYEQRNLAKRKDLQPTIQQLKKRLDQWWDGQSTQDFKRMQNHNSLTPQHCVD